MKTIIHLLLIIGMYLPNVAKAQTSPSNTSLAEKIYLQLDKDIYTTGSTIWFKSIVTKSLDNTPTDLSGVLYVEIINAEKKLIEKKLIKLNQGIGEGHFDVPETFQAGTYLIRAYTEWNKNFDTDFFFEKYIQVFSPLNKNNKENVISDVTLIKDPNEDDHLKAIINPFVLDSLHKNKLQLYITIDNIKDSVSIKKEKDDSYQIDYVVPKESQMATFELITSNQKTYSKTIVLDEQIIDLQFFPESGELAHSLSSKVGFKALDAFGSGTKVEGDIVDQNNTLITSFKSNSLGMGSFELSHADSTQTYYARLVQQSNRTDILYPLPKIASLGNVLSISEKDKNITIITSSNYLKNDSIYLNVSFRGLTLYDLKAQLKNGNLKFLFSSNDLPEGIIVFKMMDDKNQAIAERIYFNKRLGNNLNIKITADKPYYAKRDLTNISIETTNIKDEPANANTSVLVINKEQLGDIQNTRERILSYFLLSSELMGHIEKPGFYFDDNKDMQSDLDALMLTQGWRHYKYAKPFDRLPFKPEVSLTVSGHVTSALSKNKRRPAEITMMTFGESKDVYAQTTDSLGNFKFNLFDELGKDMGIVLQSAKKSGTKVNYNFSLDRRQSPAITFNHKKSVEKLDSIADLFLRKEDEKKLVYNNFSLNSDDILLDEVIIEAYKLTPNRKKVIDRFGKPDRVIEGDDVAEKEKKWSFGLYSVLMFSFSDKLIIERGPDGVLYAKGLNNEMTLVVIDGIPVRPYEYQLIESIPPSEVSSVEVIEYAKNFTSLFCELFPQACLRPDPPPQSGNIIAIYTHAQQGLHGVKSPKGILKTTVPVFSQLKEFYAPKYNNVQADDLQKPDLRSIIHWQPILKTDDSGVGKTSFYNADIAGEMMVIIEAINEDGAVGYQEYTYKVE
ncbi:MG2 domain-containing protein [Confluentibacter citreus]|uniref:MG2 domain-containing protein n=1 Tax=Confluentibacter citreus TaxID=2007307 RepID=UPI0012FD1094|nr:MG2 domain-containing protein [Confluentibacter citreus]